MCGAATLPGTQLAPRRRRGARSRGARDRNSCRCVGRRIEEIDLPRGAAIAAIVRGDKVIMAHHDTVVLAEDHLIVFVTDKKLLPKVEKLFEVSVGFV